MWLPFLWYCVDIYIYPLLHLSDCLPGGKIPQASAHLRVSQCHMWGVSGCLSLWYWYLAGFSETEMMRPLWIAGLTGHWWSSGSVGVCDVIVQPSTSQPTHAVNKQNKLHPENNLALYYRRGRIFQNRTHRGIAFCHLAELPVQMDSLMTSLKYLIRLYWKTWLAYLIILS